MLAFGLALAGVVTLWLPAFAYRIDRATCAAWPSGAVAAGYSVAYVAGVALLSAAWLRVAWRREPQSQSWAAMSLRRVLLLGAVVHALALVGPPFASNDPLYYAAIGRAMARYHASPATQLSTALPPGDPVLARLPQQWRDGTSPYGPVANHVAAAVARLGGDDVTLQLRLFQLLNAALVMLTALVAGRASGARAAALVAFCPVAVIDGTINPHNDVLYAPLFALFALAVVRRRQWPALAAALAAVAVKLSAALVAAVVILRAVLRPVAARIRPAQLLAAGALAAALAVAALVFAMQRFPALDAFTAVVGDPRDAEPHFSRSLEALPRAALFYLAHQPRAAWIVGLVFRAASGVWLLYAGFRAAREDALLAWSATTVFIYYLFFHAYMHEWYLIPLLPLATQLPERLKPAYLTWMICWPFYYALALPLDCDARPVVLGAKEFFEAAIVFLPAFFVLLRIMLRARASRARASAGTSRPAA